MRFRLCLFLLCRVICFHDSYTIENDCLEHFYITSDMFHSFVTTHMCIFVYKRRDSDFILEFYFFIGHWSVVTHH